MLPLRVGPVHVAGPSSARAGRQQQTYMLLAWRSRSNLCAATMTTTTLLLFALLAVTACTVALPLQGEHQNVTHLLLPSVCLLVLNHNPCVRHLISNIDAIVEKSYTCRNPINRYLILQQSRQNKVVVMKYSNFIGREKEKKTVTRMLIFELLYFRFSQSYEVSYFPQS